MTDIGNRPTVRPDASVSVLQAVLMPGILVVLNVAALVASMMTSSWYDHYNPRSAFECGHTISMPLGMTVIMWLAVAAAAASVVLAIVFFRRLGSRDTSQGLAALVRVLCLLLCVPGVIITAMCVIAILQRQPSTVTCTGP